MPKIDVNETLFFELLGETMDAQALEAALPVAKAELDGWVTEGAPEDRVIKIELNDTNRPDLWSTAGLARQLKSYRSGKLPTYHFFSSEQNTREAEYTIKVEKSVEAIRPYLAAFVVSGKAISDAMLRDMIQTQEKLCWNFGRKRRSVSMGLYRIELIKWPVRYYASKPEAASFVPLAMEQKLNLKEILQQHPKGKEYGFILEGNAEYPLLSGADQRILSFPPIINSNDLGAVQTGDTDLLVEFTGSDMMSICLSANIVACDFADAGYTVKPVQVDYEYDTPFGRSVVFPYYFQVPATVDAGRVTKLLGDSISPELMQAALYRMGMSSDIHGQYVRVMPPPYRNDFLHAVDLVEDVMIGRGMDTFLPERPHDFTIGRLTPIELLSRRAKELFVGLGYQEMIYNYLGSRRDYLQRMNLDDTGVVRIANPMTENYEIVRPSILPCLLQSEAVSSKAPYPHRIFECGKVAFLDSQANYGSVTRQRIGFLSAHPAADFNEAASLLSAVLYFLNSEYAVEESDDPRFIPGRQATLLLAGKALGVFGEVHPSVLENWGINMPAVCGEFDLETLLG
ncbi:MAG: phenylalanine--tRNA ligase subunit beta [Spirochaetes bacterium]|nr:phenylalanine--tRNA ligase subunit beta [Spirochaetota bacterium]MBU0956094.1 phenylalanine--tRNA ligase subunit beta [Spirochaetota bacterium]